MSFLNVLLLGGAAAFTIPLVIHLLTRARFRSLDWGAMHLLEAALQANSRRPRWEHWLLLLLRCLIPILFALGLARPVLTSLRVMGAGGEKSIAIMLDDSLSMGMGDAGTQPFDRAVEEINELAGRYPSAELALWTSGGRPTNALGGTSFSADRLEQSLLGIKPIAGNENVIQTLAAGVEQLNAMANPSKQLVLVSDFQAAYWRGLNDADLEQLAELLTTADPPVQLSLLRVQSAGELSSASTATAVPNLSIRIEVDDSQPVRVDDIVRATGHISNHGPEDVDKVQVVFRVGESALASRTVSVPAGAEEQVEFACEFAAPGWHSLSMEIDDASAMEADDRSDHVVHVISAPNVLIVDPSGDKELIRASGYLQHALAPFKQEEAVNPFAIRVEQPNQIRAGLLEGVDAIVLTDVANLDEQALQAVVGFVRDGGGLIVFAGPRLNADWFNAECFDKQQLLPMKFGKVQVADADAPQRIAKRNIDDPNLGIFNTTASGDLSTIEFTRWLELVAPESVDQKPAADDIAADSSQQAADDERANNSQQAHTLLRLNSGDAWSAAREFGAGYVLQCATNCSDDWSNMPTRPVYVPLMQRLLAAVTSRRSTPANVSPGETLVIHRRAATSDIETSAIVHTPSGRSLDWKPVANQPFVFDQTQSVGLYRVEAKIAGGAMSPTIDLEPSVFAVTGDRRESDLLVLSHVELETIAEKLGATSVDSAESFVRQEQRRSNGQEIWRYCLMLLVACLFGETLLGRRITRGTL